MNGEEFIPVDFSKEVILAWRAWRVAPEPATASCGRIIYSLMSLHKWNIWQPRKRFEAACFEHPNIWATQNGIVMPLYFRNSHSAPKESCKCGIYGTKTKSDLEEYIENSSFKKAFRENSTISEPLLQNTVLPVSYLAIGKVSLYGTVIECDTGWRAQYAYPYDITIIACNEAVASEIRERYQIDVSIRKMTRLNSK